MDGTFKYCPPQFKQLYTVHGVRDGAHAVCAYALLPDKSEATYVEFLDQIKLLTNNVNPTSIMTDFELAAINAAHTVYPQADQSGCLFHLSKNIFSCVQDEGLQVQYNNNQNNIATNLRMVAALAFVPEVDVVQAFNDLKTHCSLVERPVLDYFEITYIGTPRRGGRHRGLNRPTFPIDLWNMHDRVLMNLPRTNNHLEGWHNGFAERFERTHPDVWKFF